MLQFGPRAPLAPAETLLEPELLRTIERNSVEGPVVRVINGSEPAAGEIALVCVPKQCEAVEWAARKLGPAIAAKQIPPPFRTIRVVSSDTAGPPPNTKAAIFVAPSKGRSWQLQRGLWSAAGIGDEVVEVFARHAVPGLDARAYEDAGQPRWESAGIAVTTIVPPADATDLDRASFIAAASAYFLAT